MRAFWLATFLVLTLSALAAEPFRIARRCLYSGMCDASGAVAISSNLFVAASDEDNILRLYRTDRPGGPIKEFDFNAFLELDGKSLEADLEAAARIGDRAYWIGSHGRNRNGKQRLNRCRLFATDIQISGDEVNLVAVGKPCKGLLDDLIGEPRLKQFHLAAAARLAPKTEGGLNIEGLSATPEGHLLIGFRNPVPGGLALLVPLLNPDEVIAAKPAKLGDPIQLNLGGLGIRDIVFYGGAYLIIAGATGEGGHFQLYRWAGPGATPEPLATDNLDHFSPEALIVYPQVGLEAVQILSDDGNRLIDGIPGKELPDPRIQTFRSFWLLKQPVPSASLP